MTINPRVQLQRKMKEKNTREAHSFSVIVFFTGGTEYANEDFTQESRL